MSEVNIDKDLIADDGGISRTDEKLVELSNGCICCTLREDLLKEVEQLVRKGNIDNIVIESTGISEPVPLAQTFSYIDDELGIDLTSICQLDTMVTVVDAHRFTHDINSEDLLNDRDQGVDNADERSIADLLIDQVEFCDVLILNKTDLVTAAGWIKELTEGGHAHHTPETEKYDIDSFVYSRRLPFHTERFHTWLENTPRNIVRSKGIVWLAQYNRVACLLSQAGSSCNISPVTYWVAAMPQKQQR